MGIRGIKAEDNIYTVTANCPCDHCDYKNDCNVECVRFQKYVAKGFGERKKAEVD